MILRETQNPNDADDANDAESGIWYRDILKTASLSSRKDTAGGLGYTPEMRLWISKRYACKTRLPKTTAIKPDTHTNSYIFQRESTVESPKHLTHRCESMFD